jgi:hypothetical protein
MHAGFRQQEAVGVVAKHGHRRTLDAGFVAWLKVDYFALETAPFDPAQVHPQQHLSPVLRLCAAGARMNGDDRVFAIVLAAEHFFDFAGLDLTRKFVECATEIVGDLFPCLRPFHQYVQVVETAFQRVAEIAIFLEPAATLQQFLCARLIFPEVRGGDALF